MELQMFLEGKLIDAVIISPQILDKLRLLQQKMEDKHSDIIDLSNADPEFFVEGIDSKMNQAVVKAPKKIIRN